MNLLLMLILWLEPMTSGIHTIHFPPGAVATVELPQVGCAKFKPYVAGVTYRDLKVSVNGVVVPKCQ
jgi:hypothetical protein